MIDDQNKGPERPPDRCLSCPGTAADRLTAVEASRSSIRSPTTRNRHPILNVSAGAWSAESVSTRALGRRLGAGNAEADGRQPRPMPRRAAGAEIPSTRPPG